MHIRAKAGPYRFLIPASSILEVWAVTEPGAAQMDWRGRRRPFVDGRSLLGLGSAGDIRSVAVYGESVDDPCVALLGLEEVAGAVPLPPSALRPFPASLTRAHLLFDGIALVPGETECLPRLRTGLDLAALAGAPATISSAERSLI